MIPADASGPLAAPPVRSAGPGEISPRDFTAIAQIMQTEARIHLPPSKAPLVQSRLGRRLSHNRLTRFRDYVELVRNDATERNAMVVALTTNHTHFFREAHHFNHLTSVVVPTLKARGTASARLWSAGCSSGEEVYSMAMCLRGPNAASAAWLNGADVRLLATDIAGHVVEATRRAVYSANDVNPIPEPYRISWLKPQDGQFAIADDVRAMVTARVLNLFAEWPMRRKYDVIFCRNVMIYFEDDAKMELEARLSEMLVPGGFLYIGHSERLIGPATTMMRPVNQTIYQREA